MARQDRELRKDLLVLDVAAALHAYPLHGEVEPQLIVHGDIVVIDTRTQKFASAGTRRLQSKELLARAQGESRGTGTVDHPDDDCLGAAVLEEMLDRVGQSARLPQSPEGMLELDEARDEHRSIEGTAQRAADERRTRGAQARNRAVGTPFFL
jgi:hypothetical protein